MTKAFKNNFWVILFFLLVFVFLIFIHSRGLIVYDEGWIVNSARRILLGNIPYKDFQFMYTPGTIFITSLFFALLGQSLVVERLVAFIFSLISTLIIFRISRNLTKSNFLSFLSSTIFLFWGPGHINFIWPVMAAITLGLININLMVKYIEKEKKSYLIYSGVFSALTLIFKQNFGAAILIIDLVYLILNKKFKKREILNYLKGYGLIISLFLIYLFSTRSLFIFFNEMYYLMIVKIIFGGLLSTPFIYPDPLLKQILKTLFYLVPLMISLFALYYGRKNKKFIILPLFSIFYYIFSIRPTTDYIHLAPLISILSLPLVSIYSLNIRVKTFSIIVICILIAIGAYSLIARGYYKWEAPLLEHNIFAKDQRVLLFVDPKTNDFISHALPVLRSNASPYIFVYDFSPMYYFLSQKNNPTKYDYIPQSLLTEKVEEEIIDDLKDKKAPIILTFPNIESEKSIISKYILSSYSKKAENGDYTIWEIKK